MSDAKNGESTEDRFERVGVTWEKVSTRFVIPLIMAQATWLFTEVVSIKEMNSENWRLFTERVARIEGNRYTMGDAKASQEKTAESFLEFASKLASLRDEVSKINLELSKRLTALESHEDGVAEIRKAIGDIQGDIKVINQQIGDLREKMPDEFPPTQFMKRYDRLEKEVEQLREAFQAHLLKDGK